MFLSSLSLLVLAIRVHASPRPTPTSPIQARDILSSIASGVENFPSTVGDVFSSLAQSIPTQAAGGIIPGFDQPTSDSVKSASGLDDDAINQLPVHILNIPGYGNWTNNTWSLLFHGQAYKEPLNGSALDNAAEGFVPDLKISQLTPEEQAQARNLTSAIYSLPVENVQLNFSLSLNNSKILTFPFPTNTDSRGEFNSFVPLNDTRFKAEQSQIQKVDVTLDFDTQLSNATSYLVPPTGITIVSDIDDILRVTKIYQPKQGLNNSFVNAFFAWENMPAIYANWSKSIPDLHFHYLTTTPEPATRIYEQFIFGTYPGGSFDTRPYNFTTFDQIFLVRQDALQRLLETFPQRKFILVGDTTNSDVMKLYPDVSKSFGNIQCILLRNTTATDSGDKFPYDTSHFNGVKNGTYFFFNNADDLTNLDLAGGQCVNSTIPQGVKFDWQNLPTNPESAALPRMRPFMWLLIGLVSVLTFSLA